MDEMKISHWNLDQLEFFKKISGTFADLKFKNAEHQKLCSQVVAYIAGGMLGSLKSNVTSKDPEGVFDDLSRGFNSAMGKEALSVRHEGQEDDDDIPPSLNQNEQYEERELQGDEAELMIEVGRLFSEFDAPEHQKVSLIGKFAGIAASLQIEAGNPADVVLELIYSNIKHEIKEHCN